ncbi:hypothetical protein EVAR_48887_1 [Eumeta japonica]|uniref:Uncharacterized protein n=1 Tax=Eumeta variegata TaxID=151549 RepID=A0A4C1YX76_EUMVA|nr:hypothetical protein EVAR_48887_1 [Eumeta japonica]
MNWNSHVPARILHGRDVRAAQGDKEGQGRQGSLVNIFSDSKSSLQMLTAPKPTTLWPMQRAKTSGISLRKAVAPILRGGEPGRVATALHRGTGEINRASSPSGRGV